MTCARAAGQLPDHPGVHGAEGDLAVLRPLLEAVDVVEEPLDLRAREVGVDDEAGLVRDHLVVALLGELVADLGPPPVLPDDGVVDGLAGLPVPHHDGLALVGDADGRYVFWRHARPHLSPRASRQGLRPRSRWRRARPSRASDSAG